MGYFFEVILLPENMNRSEKKLNSKVKQNRLQ